MPAFFSIPDKEQDYKRYMLFVLAIMWAIAYLAIVSIGFIVFPELWRRWIILIGTALMISSITLVLNRQNRVNLASIFFTVALWLLVTAPCYTAGGIMATGILPQMSVILTASFLLGWRGGINIGLLTVAVDFWFAYLEMVGKLPKPSIIHTPITRWTVNIIPFGTIIALQYYATNHLHSGFIALQKEIGRREDAEKAVEQTVHNLQERVKELKTLNVVSNILLDEDSPLTTILQNIVDVLPDGWQFPEVTAARIYYAGTNLSTSNYEQSVYNQLTETKTESGSLISIEVVYLKQTPEYDEGPFLREERSLITMLASMIKMSIDRRERREELKDYKYSLDVGYMIAISDSNERFTFVNENFCRTSKYAQEELLGKNYSIITSGHYSHEHINNLRFTLQGGKFYRGEFCYRAKDGSLFWVDTTIIPFLDDTGNVYQFLSINHDITERKEASNNLKKSAELLRKITDQVPGNTYMFEIEETGRTKILFLSSGTDIAENKIYDFTELSESLGRGILHPDDYNKFNEAMKEAYQSKAVISLQYRILLNGLTRWRWMKAVSEQDSSGKTLWYGSTTDITPFVDYIAAIEQIIFDIGHIIRRPVSSMLGLTDLLSNHEMNEKEIKDLSKNLSVIAEEIDRFVRELNDVYQDKRKNTKLNLDISRFIDQRGSMFNKPL